MTNDFLGFLGASQQETSPQASPLKGVLNRRPRRRPSPDAAPQGMPEAPHVIERDGARLEIPAQFWDGQKNEVDIPALLKSQRDLRARISSLPKAPESYALQVPDDMKERIALAPDDPLAQGVMEWAKANNVTQEQFATLTHRYFQAQATAQEASDRAMAAGDRRRHQKAGNDPRHRCRRQDPDAGSLADGNRGGGIRR